ncbi:hypothetical protein B0F90DRAFT_1700929 [Multifurca ochricompacta]|uniref:Zn(2)-C6 fungal-type domain-containing protein n=1 Tax=Multifurca ochricompacta TaxID=376703 RepID=A0AAD4M8X8_9AGAM|nr:hypothetical protein B0F90DRAFT_1700929 [Multifurca ochricompacta]
MTCRQKKIKCDENKPKCHRCAHGQRDCTWPVGVEPRKRAPPKRIDTIHMDPTDVRPSTASSSGISEGSTPPTRNHTPPKRDLIELDLPPLTQRRHSDLHGQPHHPHGHSMASLMDPGHRSSLLPISSSSHFHPPSSHHATLSVIPELSNSYLTLPPVDQLYTPAPQQYSSHTPLGGGIPRVAQTSGPGYRYYENMQPMSNWMTQAQPQLEPMDSYFSHTQDRYHAGTPSSDTQPNRYH